MNTDQHLNWIKSSASGSGNCVEVAGDTDQVLVRNTRERSGATLSFTAMEWQAFILGMHAGEFDLDALSVRH